MTISGNRNAYIFEGSGTDRRTGHIANLSAEDLRLLEEMHKRGRVARISDGRPRHGAERLVDAGLATSRALSMSDVEYEMTPLGVQARVLGRHGIPSATIDTIEPHKFDVDGLWYVKVSSAGNPTTMMQIGAAKKLADHLRTAGADELADRLDYEIDRARRFTGVV